MFTNDQPPRRWQKSEPAQRSKPTNGLRAREKNFADVGRENAPGPNPCLAAGPDSKIHKSSRPTDFEAEGLAPSAKQLHALDVFQGRSLIFQHEGQSDWHKGIGRGIDEHGRLCIACEPPGLAKAGIERLSQGSVRLLQSQAELKS
ncbi:MAG: hypothetical protein EBZ03_03340 [Betaproteobacteria bacterium]|nr:hypothetical protein [Betaproteobacteria bacterium]